MVETSVNIGMFILEDDAELHELIEMMLDETGFKNYSIHDDPDQFLAELDSDINICVIDHRLNSNLTGLDVIKKVKEKNKWSFVIIMTGQQDKSIVVDYLNAGADKYVDKSRKTVTEYMDDLISKLLTGLEVAKERIRVVKLLEATKEIL